jgi:hypothetical protein
MLWISVISRRAVLTTGATPSSEPKHHEVLSSDSARDRLHFQTGRAAMGTAPALKRIQSPTHSRFWRFCSIKTLIAAFQVNSVEHEGS